MGWATYGTLYASKHRQKRTHPSQCCKQSLSKRTSGGIKSAVRASLVICDNLCPSTKCIVPKSPIFATIPADTNTLLVEQVTVYYGWCVRVKIVQAFCYIVDKRKFQFKWYFGICFHQISKVRIQPLHDQTGKCISGNVYS